MMRNGVMDHEHPHHPETAMPNRFLRHLHDHPRSVDVLTIGCALVLSVYASFQGTWGTTPKQLAWWPGVSLSVLACAALWWHRSNPQAVVVVTGICATAASAYGYLTTPLLFAPVMVALYWLALEGDRKSASLYALAVAVLLIPSALLTGTYKNTVLVVLNPAFFLFLPVAWGSSVQVRRAYVESLFTRAELAERTREEEARRRVGEERVRIARELHDVVAHHLALANAQAGTAAHLVRRQPEQAEHLISELAGTTASALRELKATVGLLRRPEETDAPLEPAPGLSRLPELVAAHTAAGLTVEVVMEGTERPLAPGTDLTAYRILQEALTNVSKHAAGAVVRVTLVYAADVLTITVCDDGGQGSTGVTGDEVGGYGLIGMRERAQSVGGRFAAGGNADGGFTVTVELPMYA
ncbi:sensor histidine kinase [Streptomyces sp. NPDC002088]|uniref:sensor histidine kinase n=1 Tax=Streptomyces sp. NPDC002088 TaxID=3154665 RepID=UPI0033346512